MPKLPSTNGHATSNGHSARLHPELHVHGEVSEATGSAQPGPGSLAMDPNLIESIADDIAAMGVVGERDAGKLVYIIASSRKQRRPLSGILLGPSSIGKSNLLEGVTRLQPPDETVTYTSSSPMAPYYMQGEAPLRHKFLSAGERSHRSDPEQADKSAAHRQLQTEGWISRYVPQKVDGKMTSVEVRVEGPISYIESTTNESAIHPEDRNRCLLIEMDGSRNQNVEVMRAIARQYAGKGQGESRDTIIARHHEFQTALQQCEVVIPYAELLADAMPAGRVESRRVFRQVLCTIEVIAFLHQFQRERDEAGRLVATMGDFAIARRLLLRPLCRSVGLKASTAQHYATLREKLPSGEFSTKAAETALNSRMVWQRVLPELVDLKVIEQVSAGKSHCPARFRWTGVTPEDSILPMASALRLDRSKAGES